MGCGAFPWLHWVHSGAGPEFGKPMVTARGSHVAGPGFSRLLHASTGRVSPTCSHGANVFERMRWIGLSPFTAGLQHSHPKSNTCEFIDRVRQKLVNDAWILPAVLRHNLVALSLSQSASRLPNYSYARRRRVRDDVFGMTRTLVDIFLTLRYIANNDTPRKEAKR